VNIGLDWRPAADCGPRHPLVRVFGVISLLTLGLPLVLLGAQGWFARYAADDYCTASQVATAGLLKAQSILYVSWSGRFAATLLISLAELIGPLAVRVLPGLTLVAWLAAATWTAREVLRAAGQHASWLASAVAATVVVYTTLQTTADLPQVLFWQTGLLTYTAPLIWFTLLVGCIARWTVPTRGNFALGVGICFGLAFVAGGSNETFAAAQVAALGVALVLAWLFGGNTVRKGLVTLLVASLAGAGSGLVLVALAPGNAERSQTTIALQMPVVFSRAVDFLRGWLRLTFARPHLIELLLLVGIVGVLGATTADPQSFANWRPRWSMIVLGVAGLIVVLLACMVPVYYALGADPPGRALVVPQYLLICALAFAAWLAGAYAASRLALRIGPARLLGWSGMAGCLLVLALAVGPLTSTTRLASQVDSDRAYASAWDALDTQIRAERASGNQDVTVPRLSATGTVQNLEFFGPDRQDWLNDCVARYYAINSISATP
jgi:hypothetical protein